MLKYANDFPMETVFDHQPTTEELITLFGSVRMAEWLCDRSTSQDGHLSKIACLMAMRGNKPLAKSYIARIQDPRRRFQADFLVEKAY